MHLAGTKIIIQAKGVDSRCTSTWMLLDMRGQVRNQHVAGGGGETSHGHKQTFWVHGNILYLSCGVDYTGRHTCLLKSWNCPFKISVLF